MNNLYIQTGRGRKTPQVTDERQHHNCREGRDVLPAASGEIKRKQFHLSHLLDCIANAFPSYP